METETTIETLKFANGGKALLDYKLALEDKNKSKRAGLSQSESGIRVGNLAI